MDLHLNLKVLEIYVYHTYMMFNIVGMLSVSMSSAFDNEHRKNVMDDTYSIF